MMNPDIPLLRGYATGITQDPKEVHEVQLHAIRVYPGKCLAFHCHLQSGAHYSLLEIDKVFHKMPTGKLPLEALQPWSCFSEDAHVNVFELFRDNSVWVLPLNLGGRYWFTVDFFGSAYSTMPDEFKQFHVVLLDNGQVGAYPNNYLLFHDKTWTGDLNPKGVPRLVRVKQYRNPESH